MENMRIALTVAKEHPMRFAAANMFPLTIAALGMGASGLTIEDYHGMLRNQPPHQQGKFLMPVPMPGGKIGFVDWTQMIPGADMLSNREVLGIRNKLGTIKGVPITVPIPQGMIFTGPAWSTMAALQNINPATGQPLVNPSKGETASKWIDYAMGVLPVPTAVAEMSKRTKSAIQGTPYTKYESSPQNPFRILPQAFAPQFGNIKFKEDLEKEARVIKRGRLDALKGGFKSIQKDRRLSDKEKQEQRENIREQRTNIKEGFR